MSLYMITGKVTEDCTVRVIQDEEFKAEKDVIAGKYVIYFESDNNSPITACAENNAGILISFGNIRPVEVLHKD